MQVHVYVYPCTCVHMLYVHGRVHVRVCMCACACMRASVCACATALSSDICLSTYAPPTLGCRVLGGDTFVLALARSSSLVWKQRVQQDSSLESASRPAVLQMPTVKARFQLRFLTPHAPSRAHRRCSDFGRFNLPPGASAALTGDVPDDVYSWTW